MDAPNCDRTATNTSYFENYKKTMKIGRLVCCSHVFLYVEGLMGYGNIHRPRGSVRAVIANGRVYIESVFKFILIILLCFVHNCSLQVLLISKFLLLQTTSPAALVRLHESELQDQSPQLQRLYQSQHHSSINDFLQHVLHVLSHDEGLLLQVCRFAFLQTAKYIH